MGFHYPKSFYWLFAFAALIALYGWARFKRRLDLQKIGDWKIISQMVSVEAMKRRIKKDAMALVGLLFVLIAATGPQFGARMKEVKQRGVDVFIAIDTSRSMLAEDVQPNRLERAKQSLGLLIKKLEGNRVGIIAFAKFAVLQCPLTTDTDAARMFLDIVDINTVPEQGTSLGDAIRTALASFNKDDKTGKAIVLLTDGEDHRSDPTAAAQEAKKQGVTIFTIGIGTTQGEAIKDRDEQGKVVAFHKHEGQVVMSHLDDALLTKLASITGGHYYRASSTDREIDEIADILNGYDKKEFATKIYERLEERYQIFGWLGLLILIFEFFFGEREKQLKRWMTRMKAVLATAVLVFLVLTPAHADVKEHVRKGNALLKKKDFVGARAEFESARIDAPEAAFLPYNIGTTYLLEGNFDEAKKSYEQALSMSKDPSLKAKAAYNLGHVAFYAGDKAGAVNRFKESLRYNPQDMDAKYNIEYIKAGKTPKNPPPQKQNNQSGQGDQKQQSQQQKNDQQNKDQNKDQQSQGQGEGQQQKQKGELSKDDAERILQMMKEQENEKLKDSKPVRVGKPNQKQKEEETGEDW